MGGQPFHMLVAGDSILWGQGLREEQKFSSQVQDSLSRALGRPVQRHVYAHSGAVLLPDSEGDARPPAPGEVPTAYPSVTAQLQAAPPGDGIHLLLLNGGINDMDFRALLDPAVTEAWVRAQARTYCAHSMKGLLTIAATRFPGAVIVVVSYYRIISEATSFFGLAHAFESLGRLRALAASFRLRPKLATLSAVWQEASTECLQRAVDRVNDELCEAHARQRFRRVPGARACEPDGGGDAARRVLLVRAPYRDEHCYAAPRTYLWRVGEPDPVRRERLLHCVQAGRTVDRHVENASAGHPNVRGAFAYAQAILNALSPLHARWLPPAGAGRMGTQPLEHAA